jgi:hypothetical protein
MLPFLTITTQYFLAVLDNKTKLAKWYFVGVARKKIPQFSNVLLVYLENSNKSIEKLTN